MTEIAFSVYCRLKPGL